MTSDTAEKITALLPMKGHSERVPNKNMRNFNGRPLFFRVLEQLTACSDIEVVAIDTDSAEIADSTALFGKVRIIDRPAGLRGDMVPMNDIIAYDLSVLEGEHFLQTHSTNPLLRAETIARGVRDYFVRLERFDSLFSVTRLQTRLYDKEGRPLNHNPAELLRAQDLDPVWEENSNIYIFSKESFRAAGNKRIGLRSQLFEIDAREAVDIDEEYDFQLAEFLFKRREQYERGG